MACSSPIRKNNNEKGDGDSSCCSSWRVLCALILAEVPIFLNENIFPLAVPSIRHSMHLSLREGHWIINAYILTLAVLVLLCGQIGDRLGRKRVLYCGLWIFGIASLFGGYAFTKEKLLIARSLQGVGGAIIAPNIVAIILRVFPSHLQGRALGIYSGANVLSLSLGPLVGGQITQYLGWPWIFWMNVPVVGASFLIFFFSARGIKDTASAHPIAWGRFALFGLSILFFTCALMQVGVWGILSKGIGVLLACGAILMISMVVWERNAAFPLLGSKAFSSPTLRLGVLVMLVCSFVFAMPVFWNAFFQDVLHCSPSMAGYIMFCSCFPSVIMAPLAGWFVDRLGVGKILLAGLICKATIFSLLVVKGELFQFIHWSVFFQAFLGVGISLVYSPVQLMVMRGLPSKNHGVASGILNTTVPMGIVVGVSLIGSLMSWMYGGDASPGVCDYLKSFRVVYVFLLIGILCTILYSVLVMRRYKDHPSFMKF